MALGGLLFSARKGQIERKPHQREQAAQGHPAQVGTSPKKIMLKIIAPTGSPAAQS